MVRQITVGGEGLPGETGAPIRHMEQGLEARWWGGGRMGEWQEGCREVEGKKGGVGDKLL